MRPDPIPPEVRELFNYLMLYAETGNLGVVSTLDKATGVTRFTLMGRHAREDGGFALVPLGFLSTAAGDEVHPPDWEPPVFVLEPERWDEFVASRADDGGPA